MTRPLPQPPVDDAAEMERLKARQAERRARLAAGPQGGTGWYARADDLLPQPEAPR